MYLSEGKLNTELLRFRALRTKTLYAKIDNGTQLLGYINT